MKSSTSEPKIYHSRLTKNDFELKYVKWVSPIHVYEKSSFSTKDPDVISPFRRADNLSQLRGKVYDLVQSNYRFYGYEPVFLTFTYKENMADVNTAWKHWNLFIKSLNREFNTKFKYLTVVEYQSRGAVHFHSIFFNMPLSIEESEKCPHYPLRCDWQDYHDHHCSLSVSARSIARIWGRGWVDIERVRSARNVGAYVCKYLDKSADDPRLRGRKFYSTSKGLNKPVIVYDNDAIELFNDLGIENLKDFDKFTTSTGDKIYTLDLHSLKKGVV